MRGFALSNSSPLTHSNDAARVKSKIVAVTAGFCQRGGKSCLNPVLQAWCSSGHEVQSHGKEVPNPEALVLLEGLGKSSHADISIGNHKASDSHHQLHSCCSRQGRWQEHPCTIWCSEGFDPYCAIRGSPGGPQNPRDKEPELTSHAEPVATPALKRG